MKHFFLISLCLAFSAGLLAQAAVSNYVRFDKEIALPDLTHLPLYACDNQLVELEQGSKISLIPPDMAKIDRSRILRIVSDTLAARLGKAKVISICELDTLYISKDLFLTHVEVEVPYFVDGTYEGTSSFGWEVLNQISTCRGPVQSGTQASLLLESVEPSALSFESRYQNLLNLAPATASEFPFHVGDVYEIRLIKCNSLAKTESKIDYMEDLLYRQPLFCKSPSVDPMVPPSSALTRIQSPITIRYFEASHKERADALGECLSYLFQVPMSDIEVVDMRPAYGGNSPESDYMEVWFQ